MSPRPYRPRDRSDTGSAELFINNSSVATVGSADFNPAGTDDIMLLLRGQGGNPLAGPTTVFFNSYYIFNDAADSSERITNDDGEFSVERFQSNKSGIVPDNGDDLDGGSWKGISDDIDEENAEYTGAPTHEGYVIMDDFPNGGPKGKVGPERTIYGAKFTWWAGTFRVSNFILIYGNDLIGGGAVTTTENTGKRMVDGSPWQFHQFLQR